MKPRRAFSLRAGVRAVAILLVLSIGVAAQVNYIPSEGPIGSPSIRRLDGSSFTPAKADSEIRRLMSAAHVTGLAVAVINNGEIAYLRTFGWRNVEEHQRLTPETIMYGASFTKSVFAYCVMQLVDDGVVNLDKPVYESLGKPLPDYKNYADLAGNNRSKKLTPRILLSHTSGFPNWRRFTDDQKLTINFEPGSRFAYSGEGIDLMQLVVEAATKQDTGELIQKRVFDRFHMTRTSMSWRSDFERDFANGYSETGQDLGHNRRRHADAAGSMDATISDMARFVQGMIRREGLSEKSWSQMFSPQIAIHSKHEFPSLNTETTTANDKIKLSYGLGWGLFTAPFGKAIFKEGHDDGWENHMVIYDKQKSAVILMSNSSNADSIYKELLEFLAADHYTPWEWEGYVPYQQLKSAAGDR